MNTEINGGSDLESLATSIAGVPIHTFLLDGAPCFTFVRISEAPEELREELSRFMRGQTVPIIDDIPPGDAIYVCDYENFLRKPEYRFFD